MIDYLAAFVNTNGLAFPDTEAVNVTAPGAGDGTEFIAAMVNDSWGARQALMDLAGLSPNGVDEAPGASQYLQAIQRGFAVGPGLGVTYWKNDTPAVFGDRVLLLTGQVILVATYQALVDATWVGAGDNATAPAFYRTSDAGGVTRDAAGAYFVLPDSRGLSLKNIGDATINARLKTGPAELGEIQEDQMQRITGSVTGVRIDAENTTGALAATDTIIRNYYSSGAGNERILSIDSANSPNARTSATDAGPTRDSTLGTRFGITY